MQRWPNELTPGTRPFPSAAGCENASLNSAQRCMGAAGSSDSSTRRCVREKTWDAFVPRIRNEAFHEQRTNTRSSSHETAYIKQDAVRFLAEKKFTETLLQEADLAETTLKQEEAMFQRCMDEIARDMRKIMEDERWVFVSEYLLHKSEQQRLKEDLGLTHVTGDFFAHPPSRCKMCCEEKDQAHIRSMMNESWSKRKCQDCAKMNERELASPRNTQHFCLQRVNDVGVPRYLERTEASESRHAQGDVRELRFEEYDCCICRMNRCCTHWPQHDGDNVPYDNALQDDDFRSPHRGGATLSPRGPGRRGHLLRTCQSCHAEAKRTHSEKIPPESTRGLAAVGGACRSEATMVSPRCNARWSARNNCRSRCPACNARSMRRPGTDTSSGDVAPDWDSLSATGASVEQSRWSRTEVGRSCRTTGTMTRLSDKYLLEEKPDVTRDKTTSQEEDQRHLVDKKSNCENSRSRFDTDEEQRLLALIEERDSLLQDALEQGLVKSMPAIISLNQKISAFLFPKAGDDSLPDNGDTSTAIEATTEADAK